MASVLAGEHDVASLGVAAVDFHRNLDVAFGYQLNFNPRKRGVRDSNTAAQTAVRPRFLQECRGELPNVWHQIRKATLPVEHSHNHIISLQMVNVLTPCIANIITLQGTANQTAGLQRWSPQS